MNREQRRKQLKDLNKRFEGINVDSGILEIPIVGTDDRLNLNLNDYDVLYTLVSISDRFTNLEATYSKDFKRLDSIKDENRRAMETFKFYKVVITDFTNDVNTLFNDEDATLKIFKCKTPMPNAIADFLTELQPVIAAFSNMLDIEPKQPSLKYKAKEGDE